MAQMPNDVIDGIFHDGYMAGYDEGYQAAIKHGRWETKTHKMMGESPCCSICGAFEPMKRKYCPNCGAKMDVEGKKNERRY